MVSNVSMGAELGHLFWSDIKGNGKMYVQDLN
jgi:hypothetical protein